MVAGQSRARRPAKAWNSAGADPEAVRVAADLVQRDQPRPAVERGVFHALGHHGAARLLEPAQSSSSLPGAQRRPPAAEQKLADGVERACRRAGSWLQRPRGASRRSRQTSRRRFARAPRTRGTPGTRRAARQHRAQVSVLEAAELGCARAGEQPGQPGYLGRERAARGRPAWRRRATVREAVMAPGESHVVLGQRLAACRVDEEAADRAERVVACGARARPVRWQFLARRSGSFL